MTDFAEALWALWPNGDKIIPGLRKGIIDSAPTVFVKYGVKSQLVLAHLMAQISHEMGAGHDVVENLDYTASRMMQVWPSRFPTVGDAAPFAHNPRALANKVYGGRLGNRFNTNDGWDFRGRGATQTTGFDGYRALAAKTGLDLVKNPDLVNDPQYFLECGVADFILCGCMPYALADDIVGVTKKLNGGLIGLDQRREWLTQWKVRAVPVPVAAPVASQPVPQPVPSIPVPPVVVVKPKQSWIASILSAFISFFKKGK